MSGQSIPHPRLVVAADCSTNEKKRWMVRAERDDVGGYVVSPPEPVGDTSSLIDRLQRSFGPSDNLLLGFDFPIGLPVAYAKLNAISNFREALAGFGRDRWENFYEISDAPGHKQPFYPRPTQQPGEYRTHLARALDQGSLAALLRRCDVATEFRRAGQCLFFTLGGAQVGAGAIVGWRDVIQPSIAIVNLWPFDGELSSLLVKPGVTIAEIYPAEAYSHLGMEIGSGTERSKTRRGDRREAIAHWPAKFSAGQIRFSAAALSWVEWGFQSDDDFDAMVGLLSMLQVVCGLRAGRAPESDEVRLLEGWILGQEF